MARRLRRNLPRGEVRMPRRWEVHHGEIEGARAALEAWLTQAEEVLRESEEPDAGQEWDEESVEHGDAA